MRGKVFRILAVAFGLGFAPAALAADMPVKARPMPMAFAYNWTGFYVGINGGGGWGRSHHNFDSAGTTTGDYRISGGLIGGTVGYNWQSDRLVFGIEGDIDWANISGSAVCPNPAFTCGTKDTWLGTARGRLGYAWDRFLPYVTGGLAFGDIKASIPTGPGQPAAFPGSSTTRAGWTIGAGVEYGLAPNWSVKAEYLYVNLGSMDCGAACAGAGANDNVNFKVNIIRAGLNYRFWSF